MDAEHGALGIAGDLGRDPSQAHIHLLDQRPHRVPDLKLVDRAVPLEPVAAVVPPEPAEEPESLRPETGEPRSTALTRHHRLLRRACQPLDRRLSPERRAPVRGRLHMDHPHRQPGSSVGGTPAGVVHPLARGRVGGHAGVEAAVGAAREIDEPAHGSRRLRGVTRQVTRRGQWGDGTAAYWLRRTGCSSLHTHPTRLGRLRGGRPKESP